MRPTTGSRQQSFSLADAIAKICAAAKSINLRENVKPHERKRIQEAFALLVEQQTTGAIPENKKSRGYNWLLQKIYNAGGAQLVMVCIIGLGRWAMLSLKEQVKLYLPEEMKKYRDEWDTQILQSVAQECWTEGHIAPFTTKTQH
ncbi:hypothetical protein DM02DRAFT_547890 [Periconia macrospinosa]|uniref:Uncharacterized protein n=1 Tax=Periconia macrospinosa TaxID=97972 RepID=A0A2V1CY27_9PLEO|nr:hypothetical protein DM02DRAFT_547890 [Periconia macrospinosa]